MSSRTTAVMLALCAVLAACDNQGRSPEITAPDGPAPEFSESVADGSTPYDWAELALTADAPIDAAQAATGGRASGHSELSTPTGNRAAEQHSFIALSTNPAPAAKGQVQMHTVFTFGSEATVHIEVDCLVIVGNQAWFSGPAKKYVIDGVAQPPGLYLAFRVQDNGEGANDPPDAASPGFSGPPMACQLMPAFPLVPNANGNIQVRQR